jgi:hypothetical protein
VRSNDPGGPQAGHGGERIGVKDGAVTCGGASSAQAWEKAPGRHFEHGWVLCVAGKLAHMPRGRGGSTGIHCSRRRKGADRPRWRAHVVDVVCKKKEKERLIFAHHATMLREHSRARMEQWR